MNQSRTYIATCVQQPSFIKDPLLKGGILFRKESGGVLSWNGGFSSVFKIANNNEIWAFKIWHTPLENMEFRYKIIKEYLNSVNLPYFVPFEYVPNGLFTGEKFLDTHRMKWVEGVTLDKFIEENLFDSDRLLEIANKFRVMMRDFHLHKISHGDLQHGNILVDKSNNLFVIDYDSMFVVGLDQMPDIVNGQGGYQHPRRIENEFSCLCLDNFSEIIIYLSLLVYSETPELWDSDTDWFLFSKEDLEDPVSSKLFPELLKSENILIKYLTSVVMKQLSLTDIIMISSLEDALLSNKKENVVYITDIINKF